MNTALTNSIRNNRSVLLTGATGFLGKGLLESLLRQTDGPKTIFLLIRSRPKQTAEQRFVQLVRQDAFSRVREQLGPDWLSDIRRRVCVLEGDITQAGLGLNSQDRSRLNGLDLVINSAANVVFDARIDEALSTNFRSVEFLLELCRTLGNIPLVHVSTCYVSGSFVGMQKEEVRSLSGWRSIVSRLEQDSRLPIQEGDASAFGRRIAESLGFRDIYTLTKCLAEQLLVDDRGDVPCTIVRPSIISAALAEPFPGWIDDIRVGDPVLIAYGRGDLNRFVGRRDTLIDYVPVDLVVRTTLAAAEALADAPSEAPALRVYQAATSSRDGLTVGRLLDLAKRSFEEWPMERSKRITSMRLMEPVDFERWWSRWTWRKKVLRKGNSASSEKVLAHLFRLRELYGPYLLESAVYDCAKASQLITPHTQETERSSAFSIPWENYMPETHLPGLRRFALREHTPDRWQAPSTNPIAELLRATALEPAGGESIFEQFVQVARTQPQNTFVQQQRGTSWVHYSFLEALSASILFSRRLHEIGIGPGARVALLGRGSPEWVIAALAIFRLGGTIVSLDPQLELKELVRQVQQVDVKSIVSLKEFHSAWESDPSGGSIPYLELGGESFPYANTSLNLTTLPAVPPAKRVNDSQIAAILFSSGTTAFPKPVPLTHRNLLSNARAVGERLELDRPRLLSILPIHHAVELLGSIVVPILFRGMTSFVERLDGETIARTSNQTRATVMVVVPRILEAFWQAIETKVTRGQGHHVQTFSFLRKAASHPRLPYLRKVFRPIKNKLGSDVVHVISVAAPLRPETQWNLRALGIPVVQAYGMTEASPVVTLDSNLCVGIGSVGKPIPGVEVRIDAPNETGDGEVLVKGPNVMEGYLGSTPEQSGIVDQWLHTGDLGRWEETGALRITGRIKDVIIGQSGRNVSPDAVEAYYHGIPSVIELSVVGVEFTRSAGDIVCAAVVTEEGVQPSKVRDAIAERSTVVPSHHRIAHLHFHSGPLPRTTTLKVRRNEVRRTILGEPPSNGKPPSLQHAASEPGAPASGVFAWLQSEISDLAKVDPSSISPEQHLLEDLGLDSMRKVQLAAAIEAYWSRRIPDNALQEIHTVKDLLKNLEVTAT